MNSRIIQGNNADVLKTFPDNYFDSIVTDPPYGIDFLGKAWDANTGALETYQECLRVLKPGGHILAFSAARTYHHLAVTIEQAGFEIRDQIMWIYSSGFPKSQDIGKSIDRQSGKASHKAELSEVKAILKQLYADSGKSTAEISRECGFNAGGYLKTDFRDKGWANNLPKDDKWITLKSVLGCGDDYDDYFITTPQIKVGEKLSGCFSDEQRYTIGASGASVVDITQSQTPAGQQWSGWGTQLKPAHEPIVLARKPIRLSIAKNCQQWGVGALHIDACRVPYADNEDPADFDPANNLRDTQGNALYAGGWAGKKKDRPQGGSDGWSRVGFSEQPVEKYQDQKKSTKPKSGKMGTTAHENYNAEKNADQGLREGEQLNWEPSQIGRFPSNVVGEIADYQKYFYCPKVGRAERHIGHELPAAMFGAVQGAYGPDGNRMAVGLDARTDANRGNNHPTVKPIELMKYLIKLVTPSGGRVLDPFNGSGSTGCAAVELDYDYTGIELDPAYVAISERRIAAWYEHTHPLQATGLFA